MMGMDIKYNKCYLGDSSLDFKGLCSWKENRSPDEKVTETLDFLTSTSKKNPKNVYQPDQILSVV